MKLIRTLSTPNYTMGHFELPNGEHILSLERPWVPAQCPISMLLSPPPCGTKGVSCIPPGIYFLENHMSEDHPNTLALFNHDLWVYHYEESIPITQRGIARTAVLIHPANWPEQLRGCIAPGLSGSKGYVNRSRDATSLLYQYLKAGDTLEIEYAR